MAWHLPGDKPLSEPMVVDLLMHLCITLSQWVNIPKPLIDMTLCMSLLWLFHLSEMYDGRMTWHVLVISAFTIAIWNLKTYLNPWFNLHEFSFSLPTFHMKCKFDGNPIMLCNKWILTKVSICIAQLSWHVQSIYQPYTQKLTYSQTSFLQNLNCTSKIISKKFPMAVIVIPGD